MSTFIEKLKAKAKNDIKTIVLAEGEELRSVKAAETSALGSSVYIHCPNVKVAKAYENLTKEVLSHEGK